MTIPLPSTSQPCFQVIVFNGEPFLEAALKSILKFAPVVAVEGPVAYFAQRGICQSTDRTLEILHDLLPEDRILSGTWSEKDQMCNTALRLIPRGTTHLFCVDADEVWCSDDLAAIFSELDHVDSIAFKPFTFYGGFEDCLGGFELRAEWIRVQRYYEGAVWQTHRPPTILANDGVPFRQKRHWDCPHRFYHYSYVMPSQVKAKIEYYASWGAGVIADYFQKVYKPWVLGDSKEKQRIETLYDGVHEWLPIRRGDAKTYKFAGAHPRLMERLMPQLKRQFEWELDEVRAGRI